MRVWVWHNGDHGPTLEVVESVQDHPRFHKLHRSHENRRLREATNWMWDTSDADYFSRIDDDILVPDAWGGKLRAAHEASEEIGVLGCWSLLEEDTDEPAALKKVRVVGEHRFMEHPWVGGAGHVMKRECYERTGPLGQGQSLPQYCLQVALRGWLNGFYFPFVYIEHLDDPRHPQSRRLVDDDGFDATRREKELMRLRARQRRIARQLQRGSSNPRRYVGWPARARRLAVRFGLIP
jgi:hypothetical protein